MAVSTGLSVMGTIQQGKQEAAQFEYQAQLNEQNADTALAQSQREAIESRRQGDLALSSQRAAASQVGSVSEGSVLDIMGQTEREVSLQTESDIYKGQAEAQNLNSQANINRINAKNAKTNSKMKAAGQLFSGASSMFSRFGASASGGGGSTSAMLPF